MYGTNEKNTAIAQAEAATAEAYLAAKEAVGFTDLQSLMRHKLATGDFDVLNRQIGGDHYKRQKIQTWELVQANGLGFWRGNALKYIMRAADKGGLQDLQKARHYLDYMIQHYDTISKQDMW